jgi:hypothetical protein
MVSSLLFLILHIFILEKGLVIKNTGSWYLVKTDEGKRHDMNLQTGAEEVIRLLPEHHVQQIGLYEKTQKKGNNNGI